MPHQSLPDNFYYMLFFFAPLLMLSGRAWEFVLILTFDPKAGIRISRRSRLFVIGVGFGVSLLAVLMLFTQYSIHETKVGLNEMYAVNHGLGIAMWATVVIHIITVPVMAIYWFWFWSRPEETYGR
jgi:hypothetical protein